MKQNELVVNREIGTADREEQVMLPMDLARAEALAMYGLIPDETTASYSGERTVGTGEISDFQGLEIVPEMKKMEKPKKKHKEKKNSGKRRQKQSKK